MALNIASMSFNTFVNVVLSLMLINMIRIPRNLEEEKFGTSERIFFYIEIASNLSFVWVSLCWIFFSVQRIPRLCVEGLFYLKDDKAE